MPPNKLPDNQNRAVPTFFTLKDVVMIIGALLTVAASFFAFDTRLSVAESQLYDEISTAKQFRYDTRQRLQAIMTEMSQLRVDLARLQSLDPSSDNQDIKEVLQTIEQRDRELKILIEQLRASH